MCIRLTLLDKLHFSSIQFVATVLNGKMLHKVCIFNSVFTDEPKIKLHHVHTHKLCSNPSILALSLDWSTGLYDSDVKIIIGDSEGFITQASFAEGQISEDCKWKLHDFQAWTVAFNYWDPQIFFSG